MATNQNNFGILNGRLTKDPVSFENKDGSKKVLLTVAVDNNYTSRDGKRASQFISCEAYVRSETEGLGVFSHIHQGDMVGLLTHLESDQYVKDGQTVYAQKVVIDSVDFKESRATTQARLAQRAVDANAAAGDAPAVAQEAGADESPFAG